MTRLHERMALGLCLLVATGAVGVGPATAEVDSCREWRQEHRRFVVRAVRCYLHGAPQQDIDEAVFEMLQREAYLTSCDSSVQVARGEMVGWRLSDRIPDEYGSAVLESLLERAGFDVSLRSLFASAPGPAAPPRPVRGAAGLRRGRAARAY